MHRRNHENKGKEASLVGSKLPYTATTDAKKCHRQRSESGNYRGDWLKLFLAQQGQHSVRGIGVFERVAVTHIFFNAVKKQVVTLGQTHRRWSIAL